MATTKYTNLRVAFLFPSLARGTYMQPILARFVKKFPNTVVFTGLWEGFLSHYQNAFTVKVVGKINFCKLPFRQYGHYPIGFLRTPILKLIRELWHFKPHALLVGGFSLWTLVALIYKKKYGGKVIIKYDGSSPSVDRRNSKIFTLWRKYISRKVDVFITNTKAGKEYLVTHLKTDQNKVLVHPYQVPDVSIWKSQISKRREDQDRVISFVTVGRLIKQKGIRELINATKILVTHFQEEKWYLNIVGDGPLRCEIERMIRDYNLENWVKLIGHVNYELLGEVLNMQDVFIFPTLEDVWGVAPLEAMALGKPVLCSKYAGAHELITEGKDGWIFDPHNPKELAELMRKFINNPELIYIMGANAKRKMSKYTPETAANFLEQVINQVIKRKR